jgi:hypothetical protein
MHDTMMSTELDQTMFIIRTLVFESWFRYMPCHIQVKLDEVKLQCVVYEFASYTKNGIIVKQTVHDFLLHLCLGILNQHHF